MRVFGGHDYYDTAMGYGHDPLVVFNRGEEQIEEEDAEGLGIFRGEVPFRLRPIKVKRNNWAAYTEAVVEGVRYNKVPVTVIVAGVRYGGIRLDYFDQSRRVSEFIWDLQNFEESLAQHKLTFEKYYSYGAERRRKRLGIPSPVASLQEYFKPKAVPKTLLDLLIEKRWTILSQDPATDPLANGVWKINQPVLKDMQFYKAVPPNMLFQEVEMWLGGVLPKEGKPMVEVSDEIRAAKHGMDKTSFRKPKAV